MANYKNGSFNSYLNILKALSDSNRLRILMSLHGCELCVCQVIELLQLAPSTVSKHLFLLKQAGLLTSHKNGRWIYYKISENLTDQHKELLNNINTSLLKDKIIMQDSKRMKEILKIDAEQLCRVQSGRHDE